jgi:hypothetical protein
MLLERSRNAGQKQRHLSERRVEKFANAMLKGQWHLTHQTIGLDSNGILIDGQHRLAAVVASDTVQQFLVVYESDPDTFDVIDTGAARSPSDSLAIAGYTNVNILAASARMLIAYEQIKGTKITLGSAGRVLTTADVMRMVESERGELLMASIGEGDALARGFGRNGAKTWLSAAVVLLMESDVPKDVAMEFLTKLRTGEMLAGGDPILAMRKWMMSDGGWISNSHSLRNQIGIAVFIKTVNAWLVKDTKKIAVFKPTVEVMPEIVVPENRLTAGTYPEETAVERQLEEVSA